MRSTYQFDFTSHGKGTHSSGIRSALFALALDPSPLFGSLLNAPDENLSLVFPLSRVGRIHGWKKASVIFLNDDSG